MIRYRGFATWVETDDTYAVSEAIIGEDRIALDLNGSDGSNYSVAMQPAPSAGVDRWLGRWRRRDGSDGHVDARFCQAPDGRVTLKGTWHEGGAWLTWVTELVPD